MLKLWSGYKTKVTGSLMAVYGLIGAILGHHDWNQAAQLIGNGLSVVFLREGVNTGIEMLKQKLGN